MNRKMKMKFIHFFASFPKQIQNELQSKLLANLQEKVSYTHSRVKFVSIMRNHLIVRLEGNPCTHWHQIHSHLHGYLTV